MSKRIKEKDLLSVIRQMKAAKKFVVKEKDYSLSEAKEQMRDAILTMVQKGYDAKAIMNFLKSIESPVVPRTSEINKIIFENNNENNSNTSSEEN